ncbi:MAG: HAD-IIB family hydrolase [Trueperaceae bacterium]|nr:HAD-IIB family hydrolase [Trueperaceae bacterium]
MSFFIACDIDHTLLSDSGELLSQNVEALHRAISQGATVVLATARSYAGAKPIHDALKLETPIVVSNGTLVCEPDGLVLKAYAIDPHIAEILVNLYTETPHHWSFRTSERAYIHPSFETKNSPFADQKHYLPTERERLEDATKGYSSLITASLFGQGMRPFFDRHSWESMNLVADFYPPSHYTHLETMSTMCQKASKGNAVDWLRNYLGLANAPTLCLGDSVADATMFSLGIGVAPANASDIVRAQAHWVAPHCDEGSVAAALERFVFQGVSTQ